MEPHEENDFPSQPFVTRASESPTYELMGGRFSFPLSGRQGHPQLFLERSPRGSGPPLHRHRWPSWEIVLEGQVRFQVDGREHVLGPGDCIYTPPNVPHAYVVESEVARIVGLDESDGRFEQLQRGAAEILAGPGEPDMEAVGQHAAKSGVEILGPPLPSD